jgi:hypothetical protein
VYCIGDVFVNMLHFNSPVVLGVLGFWRRVDSHFLHLQTCSWRQYSNRPPINDLKAARPVRDGN